MLLHGGAPVDLAHGDDQLRGLLQHPLVAGLLGVAHVALARKALEARCGRHVSTGRVSGRQAACVLLYGI